MPNAEVEAIVPVLKSIETYPDETFQLLRYFTGYAPAFRQVADELAIQGEKP
jgi:hypothetical protein